MAAFAHAAELGVDAIECDVHLSRDGEVVVIHDPTLDRTTDATGPVAARTAAELAAVDAAFHFGDGADRPYRGTGIGVARLEDVLRRFDAIPFIVEIKGDQPELATRTLKVIRATGAEQRVIVGGFSQRVLARVRELEPAIVTSASSAEARAALRRSWLFLSPRLPRFRLFQVPVRLGGRQVLTRRFVRAARRGGLPVQAWVVADLDEMSRLVEWGVTGLISDRPDLALRAAQRAGPLRPS